MFKIYNFSIQTILTNVTNFAGAGSSVFTSYIAVIARDSSYQGSYLVSQPIAGTDFNTWSTAVAVSLSTLDSRSVATIAAKKRYKQKLLIYKR